MITQYNQTEVHNGRPASDNFDLTNNTRARDYRIETYYDPTRARLEWARSAFINARVRAEKSGREFTISRQDVIDLAYKTDVCDLLNITLDYSRGQRHAQASSPSLDRIDNTLGYTPSNIWIISHIANAEKGIFSLTEYARLLTMRSTKHPLNPIAATIAAFYV
jgi:hypothetical protein